MMRIHNCKESLQSSFKCLYRAVQVIFVTLLLLIHTMYRGVVCVLYWYCMIAVLIDLYTLAKSEYVSFPIGMSALCNRSNSCGVVGICRLVLD